MNNSIDRLEFKDSFKKIAIPVALQQLFFISLNLIDSLMVGRLGQNEYNGVSLGGQYFFIVNLFIVGVSSTSTIFTTQFFGSGDLRGFRKSAGLGIISSLIVGLTMGSIAIFFPEYIMEIFTKDSEIIREGAVYLRIIGFQIPIFSFVYPLSMASRVSQNAKLPLKISIVSLLLNTVLNYLLIFGKLGFSRLGVSGAGIATLSASCISLLLYLLIIGNSESPLKAKLGEFIAFSRAFVFKVFKTGWTIILHEVLWVFGISLFSIIISRFNSDSYTSYDIAVKFMNFGTVFTFSISSTASVIIGGLLGRKEIEKALAYEKLYSKTQVICGLFAAILVVILNSSVVWFYNVSDSIKISAIYVCIVITIFMPITSYSAMQAAGILRSGGDTKIPVFLELSGNYFINLPILFLLLKYTNLDLHIIMIFANLGNLFTAYMLYRRVKKGNWAKNLIE